MMLMLDFAAAMPGSTLPLRHFASFLLRLSAFRYFLPPPPLLPPYFRLLLLMPLMICYAQRHAHTAILLSRYFAMMRCALFAVMREVPVRDKQRHAECARYVRRIRKAARCRR